MGFWDGVKSVALGVKCFSGWHSGDYKNVSSKPNCFSERICSDCGKYESKIEHKYGLWEFHYSKSCDAVRSCIYCNHQQKEVRHQYTKHGKDSNCKIIEVCIRCNNKIVTNRVEHSWVTIPFTNIELKLQGKRMCSDCKLVEEIYKKD
jgi:hypothetical protein